MPISATGFLPPENNATTTPTTTTTPGISTVAASTTSPLNTGDVGGGKSGLQVSMYNYYGWQLHERTPATQSLKMTKRQQM